MNSFKKGFRAGFPIGLGYLSVSFTFGLMAVSYGFTWWEALIISMTTVTSAGQFSGITTMLLPGQYVSMLISQLTINVRYSFMSISLSSQTNLNLFGRGFSATSGRGFFRRFCFGFGFYNRFGIIVFSPFLLGLFGPYFFCRRYSLNKRIGK